MLNMKKRILKNAAIGVAVCSLPLLSMVGVNGARNHKANLLLSEAEALSSCEVTKGGTVKYVCKDNEGECKATYLGITLKCSGTKVKK